MIEIIPQNIDSALIYFHTAYSSGDEIKPFLEELKMKLPNTYLWAGDGYLGGSEQPFLDSELGYGGSPNRYWFAFPMKGMSKRDFIDNIEPMGAVLTSCGAYVNAFVDQIVSRFNISTSKVVLCGHQHGSCVALSSAMIRRNDPFSLDILFDPFLWETYYLKNEKNLPPTRVICVDNKWIVEREKKMNTDTILYKTFQNYGINAEGVTLPEGKDKPDEHMFRETIKYLKELYKR